MNSQPQIRSPYGPISVSKFLNIHESELTKLTQGELIHILRLIHSGQLLPADSED